MFGLLSAAYCQNSNHRLDKFHNTFLEDNPVESSDGTPKIKEPPSPWTILFASNRAGLLPNSRR
jgi:hypothetical protein